MNQNDKDLATIKLALERCDMTDEQREELEWAQESFASPLMIAAKQAFERGDSEVAMTLAKAFLEQHRIPGPPDSDCVIYCRVSTEQQTKGSGLWRQLKTCMDYAKAKNYSVVAVFSEVWTGVDDLHVRGQVERMAKIRNCKILCESHDRWSRKGVDDLPPQNVEMTSEFEREFEEQMRKLFTPAQLYMMNSRLM